MRGVNASYRDLSAAKGMGIANVAGFGIVGAAVPRPNQSVDETPKGGDGRRSGMTVAESFGR
jgi:hypothetical protein